MPAVGLLLCMCYMQSYAQHLGSVGSLFSPLLEQQNQTTDVEILIYSLMEDVLQELNKTGIDYANLTNEYNKLCTSRSNWCRNCTCHILCWKKHDCCPDCPHVFLKRGCVNVAIRGRPIELMMIDKCPYFFEGDIGLEQLCSSNTSEIAPVSYKELDFKNRYCAKCHGIDVYEMWDVAVTCQNPIPDDMKLDGTLEETLGNSGCEITLRHPHSTYRMTRCSQVSQLSQIDHCNATGLWKVYDKGLSWACEALYSLPYYGVFKNVYCYLCNPSLASTTDRPPVESCISNKTCSSESGFSERLSPYGSVCMLECNDIGMIRKLDATVDDNVTVTTSETVNNETGQSKVEIQLLVSDTDQIFTTVKPLLSHLYDNILFSKTANTDGNVSKQSTVIDTELQEQLRTYSAICGDILICDTSFLSDTTGDTKPDIQSSENVTTSTDTVREMKQEVEPYDYFCGSSSQKCILVPKIQTRLLLSVGINPVCGRSCTCGPDCLQNNTCCVDILLRKPLFSCYSETDFPVIYPSEGIDSMHTDTAQDDITNHSTYSIVSSCLDESSKYFDVCTNSDSATDLLSHIPVTAGDILYRNIYCMLCNQIRETFEAVLDIELECSSYLEVALFSDIRSMLSVARANCKTTFKPKTFRPCRKQFGSISGEFYATDGNSSFSMKDVKVFSKCNESGMWAENNIPIRRLCEDDLATSINLPEYRVDLKVYKNFACFECNPEVPLPRHGDTDLIAHCAGNTTEANEELRNLCLDQPSHERWFPFKNYYCAQCNLPPLIVLNIFEDTTPSGVYNNPITGYTYRHLFSLVSGRRTFGSNDDTTCVGIYDTEKKQCRFLGCGGGRTLVNNSCRIIQVDESPSTTVPNVTYQLRFRVNPHPSKIVEDVDTVSLETLCHDLLNNLWDNFFVASYSCQVYNVSCETTNVTVHRLPDLVLSYNIYNVEVDLKDVVQRLVDSLSELYTIESNSGYNISLRASPVSKRYIIPSHISTCRFDGVLEEPGRLNIIYVDKFLNCPYVRFEASEVDVDTKSGSIKLHHDGRTFEEGDYQLSNDSFIICKQDYNSSSRREMSLGEPSSFMKAYTIFNRSCILLSLVCLFFTFFTFTIFKTLRSIPGKNIMTLTSTLFIAQFVMLIAPYMHTSAVSCVALGVVVHYFWLAMFCAMCMCSFHMFKLFYIGHLSRTNQNSGSSHTVAKYNAFVFGVPFVVVSLVIICHLSITDGSFSGYTRTNFCFLSGMIAILFGFILPVLLLNISSITLFSLSFHKIRTSPHMRGKEDRHDVMIYLKLCTIVGITWPLQIVDATVDMSVLSFIVVCFNALQGVFIFFAYICNSRVLRLYKNLIVGQRSPTTTGNSFPINTTSTKSTSAA